MQIFRGNVSNVVSQLRSSFHQLPLPLPKHGYFFPKFETQLMRVLGIMSTTSEAIIARIL